MAKNNNDYAQGNGKENVPLMATFNRRDFLGGLLVGGAAVATGTFFLPGAKFKLDDPSAEVLPRLDRYPITLWDDFYRMFMHVGQTLFPRVRRLAVYQEQEADAFRIVWAHDFFLCANDYALRIQTHYDDTSLVIPSDRELAQRYLAESIRAYPQAWSKILRTMLTHSPGVLLTYLSEEKP